MVFAAAGVTVTAGMAAASGMAVAETVATAAMAFGLMSSTKMKAAGACLLAGLRESFVRKAFVREAPGRMLPKVPALKVRAGRAH